MKRKTIPLLTAAVTCAAVASLTVFNPPMEAQPGLAVSLNVLSPEKEAAMGVSEFEKYKASKQSVRSGAQYELVQNVANRLTKVITVPNAQWEFVLFQDNTPNAFALPGGKVGVHTGIFNVAKNEAQLAAVLGHELAHVKERHSGERISTAVVGSAIGGIAGALLQKKGVNAKTSQTVAQGATTLGVLSFSRKQELEADHLGTVYMAKAGYNPQEAVTLWTQFAAYKAKAGGNAPPAFLSTHPVDAKRIEELKRIMPEALAVYKPGKVNPSAVVANPPVVQPSGSAASSVTATPEIPKAGKVGLRSAINGKN